MMIKNCKDCGDRECKFYGVDHVYSSKMRKCWQPKEKEIDFICKHCGAESSILCNNLCAKCDGFVMGEKKYYLISRDEIKELYSLINHSPGTAKKSLEKSFPDVFEEKQAFCCDVFEEAVKNHEVMRIVLVADNIYEWYWGTNYSFKHCFNCGKKPIKPISGKE
jgi:hypothetical protein